MLILRAFPFSLNILWRMILVSPLMLLAFAMFSVLVVMYGFALALILTFITRGPVAVILMSLMISGVISVMPTMIGARLGFQARGVEPRNTYAGLILPAIGYGLVEGLISLIVGVAAIAVFALLVSTDLGEAFRILEQFDSDFYLDGPDLPTGSQTDDPSAAVAWSTIDWSLLALSLTLLLTPYLVRAALLVPIASAAIGRDPNGADHTPFFGLGMRFLSMLGVTILSLVTFFLFLPVLVGIGELFLWLGIPFLDDADIWARSDWSFWLMLGIVAIFWFWAVSAQAAGGVLAYLDRQSLYQQFAEEEAEATKQELEEARKEIGNLWRDRMKNGPQ